MPATLERPAVAPDKLLNPADDLVAVMASKKARILTGLAASSYWAERVHFSVVREEPRPLAMPASMLEPIEFDDEPGGVYMVADFDVVDDSDESW